MGATKKLVGDAERLRMGAGGVNPANIFLRPIKSHRQNIFLARLGKRTHEAILVDDRLADKKDFRVLHRFDQRESGFETHSTASFWVTSAIMVS